MSTKPSPTPVTFGVPSVPIVYDIPDSVKYTEVFIFADDTKLLLPIGDSINIDKFLSNIKSVVKWSKINNVNLVTKSWFSSL